MALEEIWHDHQRLQAGGQQVGALQRLLLEAKDVVKVDEASGGTLGAGDVYGDGMVSIDSSIEGIQKDIASLNLHVLNPAMSSYWPLGL